MSRDDRQFRTNRRRFLSTLGAVGLATTGVQTAAATGPDRVQVRLGNLDSPVPEKARENARRRALSAFEAAGGPARRRVGNATSETDGERVASLAAVTDEGKLVEYVARANDRSEAQAGRERVQEVAADLRQNSSGPTATSDDLSTQSAYWDWKYSHTSWEYTDPYGEIENEAELVYLEDDGRSEYDGFVVKHNINAVPGEKKYDSNYSVRYVNSTHEWENASELYRTVDFEPTNDHTGPKTVGVSISPDPEYSYSFDLGDGTISRDSTQNELSNGIGKWSGSYNWQTTGTSEQRIVPASSAWMYQHTSGTYDLATLTAEGVFAYSTQYNYYEGTVSETKTIQVEYTDCCVTGDTS